MNCPQDQREATFAWPYQFQNHSPSLSLSLSLSPSFSLGTFDQLMHLIQLQCLKLADINFSSGRLFLSL